MLEDCRQITVVLMEHVHGWESPHDAVERHRATHHAAELTVLCEDPAALRALTANAAGVRFRELWVSAR